MKISRRNLNFLIENFLLEDDQEENSEKINYEGTFNIGSYTFEININSKTGVDVNVEHKSAAINARKVEEEEEISEIISGILNHNKGKKESMQKLVDAYKQSNPDNTLNNTNFRKNLVHFRSKYSDLK
jgi:hypothetical protein